MGCEDHFSRCNRQWDGKAVPGGEGVEEETNLLSDILKTFCLVIILNAQKKFKNTNSRKIPITQIYLQLTFDFILSSCSLFHTCKYFSKPFVGKLFTSWPFIPKYFSVFPKDWDSLIDNYSTVFKLSQFEVDIAFT